MKQIRRDYLTKVHLWELFDDCSPAEVSNKILNLIDYQPEKYRSFKFEVEDGVDSSIDVHLYKVRLETDEEYSLRLNREAIHYEATRNRELSELKRLKEKYESSSD